MRGQGKEKLGAPSFSVEFEVVLHFSGKAHFISKQFIFHFPKILEIPFNGVPEHPNLVDILFEL